MRNSRVETATQKQKFLGDNYQFKAEKKDGICLKLTMEKLEIHP